MNAYLTFIRSVCKDQQTVENHMLYYVRTELALHKIQFCRDLKVLQTLKASYRERFVTLTDHIINFSNQVALGFNLTKSDHDALDEVHDTLNKTDFDKAKLDQAVQLLTQIFNKTTMQIWYNELETKVIPLSA